MFTEFRKEVPVTKGFYVFRYREGHEIQVYVNSEPDRKFLNHDVYSYSVSMENTRDAHDCGMDFGQYVWVNSYTTQGPKEWREMTPEEALAFSNKLFHFGRPSWAYPKGRKVLTPADVA